MDINGNNYVPRIFNNTFGDDGFINNSSDKFFERNKKSLWKNGETSFNSSQKSAAGQFG
jgi:phosphoribosyl-AMP cyclohydrolase